MSALTRTSTQLLQALFDPTDAQIWSEFDARYRPILFAVARRTGLGEADAADVAQDSISAFLVAYREGRYDRTRGRLGGWLLGIARNHIRARLSARRREAEWGGGTALAQVPEEAELRNVWRDERRLQLIRVALDALREETRTSPRALLAFERTAIDARPVEEVAAELGMSAHDVYMARHRVTRRLRSKLEQMETMYDDEL